VAKLKVIKKITQTPCYRCGGSGETKRIHSNSGTKSSTVPCRICRGTGKYREYHYTYILGNMAIDCDTLK
jgi:DnaJ-class molecular chaperone